MMRRAAVCLALGLLATPGAAQRIIDGDTLQIGGQSIRLHGMDAPELHQACAGGRWVPWAFTRYRLDYVPLEAAARADALGVHGHDCERADAYRVRLRANVGKHNRPPLPSLTPEKRRATLSCLVACGVGLLGGQTLPPQLRDRESVGRLFN